MQVNRSKPKPRNQVSLCPDFRGGDLVFVKTYGLRGVVEAKDGTTIGTLAYWTRLDNGKLARVCWYDLEPISE